MLTKITCPKCQREGTTSKIIPPNAKVKCPGCQFRFDPQQSSKLEITTKECPACGNEILIKAQKCLHCQEWLNKLPQFQYIPNQIQRPDPLIAGLLSFLLPGLGQMYKGQTANGIIWLVGAIFGYMLFIIPGIIIHICAIFEAVSRDRK